LWTLLSLVIASEGTFLGFLGVNFDSDWSAEPVPGLRYCVPMNVRFLQKTHYLTWVPTLAFDTIIFLLSLIKFVEVRTLSTPGVFKRSLMWTLLHDSIVYFALLLAMAIIYMTITRINVENGESASNIIFPIISAAGCRLLFHIRSKERAQVLGLDNTAMARDHNGTGLFSDDVASARPIEFQVFTRKDRTVEEDLDDEREPGMYLSQGRMEAEDRRGDGFV